jgi:hypothetical protein
LPVLLLGKHLGCAVSVLTTKVICAASFARALSPDEAGIGIVLQVSPRYAAVVVGVSNTIASLPGVFGNLIAGVVLQLTGSWQIVFAISVGVQAAGCFFYCGWARGDVVVK